MPGIRAQRGAAVIKRGWNKHSKSRIPHLWRRDSNSKVRLVSECVNTEAFEGELVEDLKSKLCEHCTRLLKRKAM